MLGTKMIPEMSVIFNQLTLQIDLEEFIKMTLKYSDHLEKLSCEEVTVLLFLPDYCSKICYIENMRKLGN